jgi:hypothetical protein
LVAVAVRDRKTEEINQAHPVGDNLNGVIAFMQAKQLGLPLFLRCQNDIKRRQPKPLDVARGRA